MLRSSLIVVSLTLPAALLFQNCSQANFDAESLTLETAGNEGVLTVDPESGEKTYQIRTDTELRYPTDVLFVIDESVSMNRIATEVRNGFAALAGRAYPPNTRLAVTNMAPAKLSGGTISFDVPYKNTPQIARQPGFLRLVSRSGIDAFLSDFPSFAPMMSYRGCASSWFSPEDKDETGVPCLIGASQISQIGTGVEAGVISLKHLIKKAQSRNQKLFRRDVNLTVIFVSDTHDPGASYYGTAGAESAMPSYAGMRNLLYAYEPTLKGLKFNAIVPLPRAGNPVLSGVNVIGALPVTAAEEIVGEEQTYGYSYLKFVAGSGGSAMHIAKNNWGDAIAQMVKDIGVLEVPVVKLGAAATEILEVKVNGVVLQRSQYSLQSDRQTLQIPRQAGWGRYLEISVRFK